MAITVDQWRTRMEQARSEREPHAVRWRAMFAAMQGRNYAEKFTASAEAGKAGGGGNPVNALNSNKRVILPHVLPRDRHIEMTVTPARPDPELMASAAALADRINALFRAKRAIDQVRDAFTDAMYGCGILKVGLNPRTRATGGDAGGGAAGGAEDAGAAAETGNTGVDQARGAAESEKVDVDRERVAAEEFMDVELPYLRAVSPFRFLIQPGAWSLDDADWVAEEIYPRLSALRADPLIPAELREKLTATHKNVPRVTESIRMGGGPVGGADETDGYVECFEVYCRDTRKMYLVPSAGSGVDEFLRADPFAGEFEGLPFDLIEYDKVRGYAWPNPLFAPTFDLYATLDTLVEAWTRGAKRSATLILYDPQNVKSDQLAAVANANDGDVVPVPGLTEHVKIVQLGMVSKDHLEGGDRVKMLADEMIGVDEFLRSVDSGAPRATAAEISVRSQASGVRMDDLRAAVFRAVEHAARKMAAILLKAGAAFADEVLPLGSGADLRYVSFGADELAGEVIDYIFEVVATSVERVDPAVKQKRNQDLIQIAMNPDMTARLQAENRTIRLVPLIERQLESMGEKRPDQVLVELQPDAGAGEAERAAEEDRAMLESGEPAAVSPTDDHAAHLQVHAADWQATGSDPDSPIAAHAAMHEQFMMQAGAGGGAGMPPVGGLAAAGTGGGAEQAGALRAAAS